MLMKALTLAGTVAMFMVGGYLDAWPAWRTIWHTTPVRWFAAVPAIGGVLASITPTLLDTVGGILAGPLVLVGVKAFQSGVEGARSSLICQGRIIRPMTSPDIRPSSAACRSALPQDTCKVWVI